MTEPSPKLYVRRLRWAGEILSALENANVDISYLTKRSLLRECNSINLTEQDGLKYLEEYFDKLFDAIDVDFRAIPALMQHHDSFFASSQDRIQRMQNDGTPFINDISAFRKVFESRSGITVSTIHGVKGAEYDTVIAYALLEGMVPHFNDDNKEENSNKMLYVIGSRARKYLHLISERGRMQGGYQPREYVPTLVLDTCIFDYG